MKTPQEVMMRAKKQNNPFPKYALCVYIVIQQRSHKYYVCFIENSSVCSSLEEQLSNVLIYIINAWHIFSQWTMSLALFGIIII